MTMLRLILVAGAILGSRGVRMRMNSGESDSSSDRENSGPWQPASASSAAQEEGRNPSPARRTTRKNASRPRSSRNPLWLPVGADPKYYGGPMSGGRNRKNHEQRGSEALRASRKAKRPMRMAAPAPVQRADDGSISAPSASAMLQKNIKLLREKRHTISRALGVRVRTLLARVPLTLQDLDNTASSARSSDDAMKDLAQESEVLLAECKRENEERPEKQTAASAEVLGATRSTAASSGSLPEQPEQDLSDAGMTGRPWESVVDNSAVVGSAGGNHGRASFAASDGRGSYAASDGRAFFPASPSEHSSRASPHVSVTSDSSVATHFSFPPGVWETATQRDQVQVAQSAAQPETHYLGTFLVPVFFVSLPAAPAQYQ